MRLDRAEYPDNNYVQDDRFNTRENPMKVTIALCTRRRQQMLGRTLDAFTRLDTTGFDLTVSIVENDSVPATQDFIDTYRDRLDIRYALETNQGLCHARNRALDEALKTQADWIAMTDDDNYPDPDWLSALVAMTKRYPGADAITGVTKVLNPRPSKWRMPGAQRRLYVSGMRAVYFTTANLLLRRAIVSEDGPHLRFDLTYNFGGGEDVDFMHQLNQGKHTLLWCEDAVINVPIDPDRQSLASSLGRKFRINTQLASISRKHFGTFRGTYRIFKRVPRDYLRALGLAIKALPALLLGQKDGPQKLMKSLDKLANATGLLAGVVGYRGATYKNTDGN